MSELLAVTGGYNGGDTLGFECRELALEVGIALREKH